MRSAQSAYSNQLSNLGDQIVRKQSEHQHRPSLQSSDLSVPNAEDYELVKRGKRMFAKYVIQGEFKIDNRTNQLGRLFTIQEKTLKASINTDLESQVFSSLNTSFNGDNFNFDEENPQHRFMVRQINLTQLSDYKKQEILQEMAVYKQIQS